MVCCAVEAANHPFGYDSEHSSLLALFALAKMWAPPLLGKKQPWASECPLRSVSDHSTALADLTPLIASRSSTSSAIFVEGKVQPQMAKQDLAWRFAIT